MKEIFKEIQNYENRYMISNFGVVQNKEKNIILKSTDRNGYLSIALHKKGNRKRFSIHRLVAIAFIPNSFNKPVVNHKDGNKLNNYADNLEWVTQSENIKHGFKTGLIIQSKENNNANKLLDKEILIIYGLYFNGMNQITIARLYNVCQQLISLIVNGKHRNYF